ncbi:MAG TPA: substrate-binding domain-containing protein, partial [Rugosimonospora sp.]|nr:substrate-binding domain-containing protein [Rugosimonospora sp.]
AVPGDLSIVVLGDSTGARHKDTDWTGLAVPREQMGRQATRLLVELLESPELGARSDSVECQLLAGSTVGPRSSTGPRAATVKPRRAP